jgi:hypothetical protein
LIELCKDPLKNLSKMKISRNFSNIQQVLTVQWLREQLSLTGHDDEWALEVIAKQKSSFTIYELNTSQSN